jgi:protein involved in polysaccharide export with SLBB domain
VKNIFITTSVLLAILISPFKLRAQIPDQERSAQGIDMGAPNIQIRPPETNNFLRRGQRIFPENVQANESRQAVGHAAQVSGYLDPNYPVGAGDKFLINFWGKIEDGIIVTINSDGQLFIPRIGAIDARGLTYAELQQLMATRINEKLKNVQFTTSLYAKRRFMVYVLGAVNSPGAHNAEATMRMSDVIAAAGGVQTRGSTQYIELRRRDEVIHVDVGRFMRRGDFSKNPFVSDGDTIFVPDLSEFVSISGAVVSPGAFEIKEINRLDRVLEELGGFSTSADLSKPLRLSRMLPTGERDSFLIYRENLPREDRRAFLLEGFELQMGDEVFVPSGQLFIPSRATSVFVTGEVRNPGARPYFVSTSVEEYIGMSGGLTSRANLSNAVIYKADGTSVPLSPRIAVEPGDTIFIPEKTFKFWQDHITILTTFLTLATTIITISR